MHNVATTSRRYKDKVYQTHLLRRTYREGGKVKHETLGNLSHLPPDVITLIRRALQGETFVALEAGLECVRSLAHGHVAAVLGTVRRLGLERLIGSRPSALRDRVVAMIVARRHLDHTLILYDVTSSYFEGRCCPLAVEVFDGNTAAPSPVAAQVEKIRHRFGLARVVLVGDRGMITQARIRDDLAPVEGLAWITAPTGQHPSRGGPGRHLRGAHRRAGRSAGHRSDGYGLQVPFHGGTRLPHDEEHQPAHPADLPAPGATRTRPRISVHVGLLRRMAHASNATRKSCQYTAFTRCSIIWEAS